MPEACQYGAKYGVDGLAGGSKGLLRKCNRACDPGETLCPRCKLLQQIKDDRKADRAKANERHIALGKVLAERKKLPTTWMSLAPASSNEDVWSDVSRIHTLNGTQAQRGLNNHICPLQFDIVDRIIRRYTNLGETVFDPFGGLMTVPYRAIKLGRKGRAAELNPEYFRDGVRYLREAEAGRNAPNLFDALPLEVSA